MRGMLWPVRLPLRRVVVYAYDFSAAGLSLVLAFFMRLGFEQPELRDFKRAVSEVHITFLGGDTESNNALGIYTFDRKTGLIDDVAYEDQVVYFPREVVAVDRREDRVTGVRLDDGSALSCGALVNAAGPLIGRVAGLLGEKLPVHSEVHLKLAFRDSLGVVPRSAPLLIWADPQRLPWPDDQRAQLEAEGRADLVGELPPACHGRPEGGDDSPWVLALWEYVRVVQEPSWPLPLDPLYAEVVLRGMATMLPGMAGYLERMPQPVIDGGYYTKTEENRPLAGPMATAGAFVAGALSGFGVMAACALAELAALHVTGETLPDYASAFTLERYDDPDYLEEMDALADTGQI